MMQHWSDYLDGLKTSSQVPKDVILYAIFMPFPIEFEGLHGSVVLLNGSYTRITSRPLGLRIGLGVFKVE
jgi:hypothetical protein